MEPINRFSPAKIANIDQLGPSKLLMLILLWHSENTKLNLWPSKDTDIKASDNFQEEWDILCGALAEKLNDDLRQKITVVTRIAPAKKSYFLTEPVLRQIAHRLDLHLDETLVLAIFPPVTANK